MPIRVICEDHPHEGAIEYPAVFCDLCGDRIIDAEDSGYYYRMDAPYHSVDDVYQVKAPIYFLHKSCYCRMRCKQDKVGDFLVNTKFGILDSKNFFPSSWGNLAEFPVFMGRNLSMDINAETSILDQFDEQIGFNLSESTYPRGVGRVYFFVDNGSITRKVKIGFSSNICERLKDLQVGSPTILRCYGAVAGTKDNEAFAHHILEFCRSHGEWFVFREARKTIDFWLEEGKIIESDF